jgi:HSP20 family molecular chaperone IbpA
VIYFEIGSLVGFVVGGVNMLARTVPEELVELDAPFAEFFRTLTGPWPFRPFLALTPGKHFMPAADVFARNGNLCICFDLPGMDPKDIHVKFDEGELIVSGERKAEKEVKEEGYYRKESSYGVFERHITLPKGTKETDIKAEYENGVLEITLPKAVKIAGLPKEKEIPVIKKTAKPLKV